MIDKHMRLHRLLASFTTQRLETKTFTSTCVACSCIVFERTLVEALRWPSTSTTHTGATAHHLANLSNYVRWRTV